MFAVEVEKVFVGFTIFDVEFMQTCLSILEVGKGVCWLYPKIIKTDLLQNLRNISSHVVRRVFQF